jgi:hypothetical protein
MDNEDNDRQLAKMLEIQTLTTLCMFDINVHRDLPLLGIPPETVLKRIPLYPGHAKVEDIFKSAPMAAAPMFKVLDVDVTGRERTCMALTKVTVVGVSRKSVAYLSDRHDCFIVDFITYNYVTNFLVLYVVVGVRAM